MKPWGVITAAGYSRRCGFDKALAKVGQLPSVQVIAAKLLTQCPQLVVVAGVNMDALAALFINWPQIHLIQQTRDEMFMSVKAGLALVPRGVPAILHQVDMPWVDTFVYKMLVEQTTSTWAGQPAVNDRRGHPILIQPAALVAILQATEGQTLRDFVRKDNTQAIPVNSETIFMNANGPELWGKYNEL